METPQRPVFTTRQFGLYKAFVRCLEHDKVLLPFIKHINGIAEEDFKASSLPLDDPRKKTVKASMGCLLQDRDEGTRRVHALLLSINPRVLGYLIDGTIGHRYVTNHNNIRNFFLPMDDTEGVYLNTLVRDATTGELFTVAELERLIGMMLKYVNSSKLDDSAELGTDDRELVNLAGAIDNAAARRTTGPYELPRFWLKSPKKIDLLISNLQHIVAKRKQLDPTGTLPSWQSPVHVGASRRMATRIVAHSTHSTLTNTSKAWGFMISCLYIAEIEFHVVQLPILKVWDKEMLGVAEILITLLAGGLVEDGGYNCAQAGSVEKVVTPPTYEAEKTQVFSEGGPLAKNLRSQPDLVPLVKVLDHLVEAEASLKTEGIEKLVHDATNVSQRISEQGKRLDAEAEKLRHIREEQNEIMRRLQDDYKFNDMVLNFNDDVKSLLKK